MIFLLGILVLAVHAALAATAPWDGSAGLFRALLACATAAAAWPLAAGHRRRGGTPADVAPGWRELLWILLVALAMHALWLPVAPTLSDDVHRYAYEGSLVRAGVSPYAMSPADRAASTPPVDPETAAIGHAELASIYPPLSLVAFACGDALGGTRGQKVVFAASSLLAALFLALWIRRRRLPAAWLALYAWSPLPALEFAGHAHHDALGLALLSAALWCTSLGAASTSAALWAASAATKGANLVTLPAFWRAWPPRARWIGIGGAVLGLLPVLLLSRGEGAGWSAYATHWSHNGLAFGLLQTFLGDGLAARAVLAFLLIVGLWHIGRRKPRLEVAALAASLWALFLSPTYHPWYGGWVLIWAAATGSAPAWLLTQLALFTYALPGGSETPGFAPVPLGIRLLLWIVPALVWLVLRWARTRKERGAP